METDIRVFISFDYDNDLDIKQGFVGQARKCLNGHIIDTSIKYSINEKWKDKARDSIKKSDVVIVLCGTNMDSVPGVEAEISIARKIEKPIIYVKGRKDNNCKLPRQHLKNDFMLKWNWKRINKEIQNIP